MKLSFHILTGLVILFRFVSALRPRDVPGCISSESQLRDAVKKASDGTKPTTILVCRKKITLTAKLDPKLDVTGIDMSRKWIELKCYPKVAGSNTCTLDAQGKTRILFGYKTRLQVSGINFANALGESDGLLNYGSAMYFSNSSNVVVDKCSFTDNKAEYAGAVHMYDSSLTVKGSSFSRNKSTKWVCIIHDCLRSM